VDADITIAAVMAKGVSRRENAIRLPEACMGDSSDQTLKGRNDAN
jgi:hypothetical protein